SGPAIVPAGSQVARVTIVAGVAGTATLRFTANGETRELTVVVGAPTPGTEPPVIAQPAAFVILPAPSAGRLITSPATQAAFTVQLLSMSAAVATPVVVTSSDGTIATVQGPVVIQAGARAASVTIITGVPGTATLRFHAGGETRELSIVVGTPPPGTEPPI